MSLTNVQFLAAFDASIGSNLTSLTSDTEKTRWFNSGQARMHTYYPKSGAVTWAAAALSVALPSDFRRLDQIVFNDGSCYQNFTLRGATLFVYDPEGTTEAGGATIFYDADWPALSGSAASVGTVIHDEACLAYALSRFYQKLCSDRSIYTRYANLVGANVVGINELTAQANQHYQDFLDAREDVQPDPPVSHTPGY